METFQQLFGRSAGRMDLLSQARERPLLVHGVLQFSVDNSQVLAVPWRNAMNPLTEGGRYEIHALFAGPDVARSWL